MGMHCEAVFGYGIPWPTNTDEYGYICEFQAPLDEKILNIAKNNIFERMEYSFLSDPYTFSEVMEEFLRLKGFKILPYLGKKEGCIPGFYVTGVGGDSDLDFQSLLVLISDSSFLADLSGCTKVSVEKKKEWDQKLKELFEIAGITVDEKDFGFYLGAYYSN